MSLIYCLFLSLNLMWLVRVSISSNTVGQGPARGPRRARQWTTVAVLYDIAAAKLDLPANLLVFGPFPVEYSTNCHSQQRNLLLIDELRPLRRGARPKICFSSTVQAHIVY